MEAKQRECELGISCPFCSTHYNIGYFTFMALLGCHNMLMEKTKEVLVSPWRGQRLRLRQGKPPPPSHMLWVWAMSL